MDIPELSETWPKLFAELLGQQALADAAHDPNHIRRVVTNARRLSLAEGAMQTPSGKAEAHQRTQFLRQFLAQLGGEIGTPYFGS